MAQVPLEPAVQAPKIPRTFWQYLLMMGPGLFIMAFHLGPGDVSTSSLVGSLYGPELLWALAVGVILLGFFTEMVGRYVAVTDKSIFDGFREVGSWAAFVMFLGVLGVFATFGSATSLAAGLAWQAMIPFPGVDFLVGCRIWGTIMLFVCFALVWFNVYPILENIIKVLVIFMTLSFLGTVCMTGFDFVAFIKGLFVPPFVPKGAWFLAITQISVVVGGITSIMYGYAVKEKGWRTPDWLRTIRFDVWAAFALLFVIDSFVIMAAFKTLMPAGVVPQTGLDLAKTLAPLYGKGAVYVLCIGLWGAAITTLFGAFLGSYGYLDYLNPSLYRKGEAEFRKSGYFKWMMIVVLVLCGMFVWVYLGPPIWMMMFMYITGALWMPVMAYVLVTLTNSKKIMGEHANGPVMRVVGYILIVLAFVAAFGGILSVFGVIGGPMGE